MVYIDAGRPVDDLQCHLADVDLVAVDIDREADPQSVAHVHKVVV